MKYKKSIYSFLASLLLLNFIFRYPMTPHEQGTDSLQYHAISYFVTDSGNVPWYTSVIHVLGLSQGSQEVGLIFTLSTFSQVTNLNLEYTILLLSFVFPLIIMSSLAFIIRLYETKNFVLIMTLLLFNLSPLIINNSTWELGTRNFSLVFFLLTLFFILKRQEVTSSKYILLLLLSIFTMASFHRIFYLLFFITLSIYILSVLLYWSLDKRRIIYHRKKLVFSFNIIFFLLILIGQFLLLRNSFIFENDNSPETFFGLYTVSGGDIFSNILIYIVIYSANVGPVIPFVLIGLISFLIKMRNSVKHYFIFLLLIFCLLVSSERTYFPLIIHPFLFILIAFGLSKFINIFSKRVVNATLTVSIVLTLLLNSMLLVSVDESDSVTLETYHIQEDTYNTALYFKNIKGKDEFFFSNSKEGSKVATINPTFGPEIYSLYYPDFRTPSNNNLSRMITDPSLFSILINREYIQYGLELDSFRNQRSLDYYKVKYALLNTRIVSDSVNDCYTVNHLVNRCIDNGKLYSDIIENRYNFYSNGKNNIYYL